MFTNYLCTAISRTYGHALCGKAHKIDGKYYCGDNFGRFCSDYCNERCGAAIKADMFSLAEYDEIIKQADNTNNEKDGERDE